MSRPRWFVTSVLLAVAATLVSPPPARAGMVFNFTAAPGTSLGNLNPAAVAGFQAAADRWSAIFVDDITINIQINFRALGAGILGSAGSSMAQINYATVRNALIADATSATDLTATANLPNGPLRMLINGTTNLNAGNPTQPVLDANNNANNNTIRMTTANAKALGFSISPNTIDASIEFSSSFTFDFDPSDGITAGSFDFVGIAAHEIGHALGFVSGVDSLDTNFNRFRDSAFTVVSTLDLFRYSTQSDARNAIDFTADNRTKYFSIDGGATAFNGATFSTGVNRGDGRQASHFKDNLGIGIMDPTSARGELLRITANDIAAFDAIGFDLRLGVATPAPASLALAGTGFLAGFGFLRRRRPAPCA